MKSKPSSLHILIFISLISQGWGQIGYMLRTFAPTLPAASTVTRAEMDQDIFWICGNNPTNFSSVCQSATLEKFYPDLQKSSDFSFEVYDLMFASDSAFVVGRINSTFTVHQYDRGLNVTTGSHDVPTPCIYIKSYLIHEAIHVVCSNRVAILGNDSIWTVTNLGSNVSSSFLHPNEIIYMGSADGIVTFNSSSKSVVMLPIETPILNGSPAFISTLDGSQFLIGNVTSLISIDIPSSQVTSIPIPSPRSFVASHVDFIHNFTYVTASTIPRDDIFKLNSSWNIISTVISGTISTQWNGNIVLDLNKGVGVGWALEKGNSIIFSVALDLCFGHTTCSTCGPPSCGWCQDTKQCQFVVQNNCSLTTCSVTSTSLPSTSSQMSTSSTSLVLPSIFNLKTSETSKMSKTSWIVGTSVGIGSVIILGVVVIAIFIIRRGKQNDTIDTKEMTSLPVQRVSRFSLHGTERKYEISFQELEIKEKIGEGASGTVFKATWRSSPVAVKKLKIQENENEKKFLEFFSEISLMKDLRPHLNVISFFGVCSSPMCVVTEYCANGSLLSLIRSDQKISHEISTKILLGVCSGMHHLATEGIVHRDLAARNILLGEGWTAKVADFGMSRILETDTEYLSTAMIGPIKWMSPESLLHRSFNEKTDVWSFGVLCVEILTRRDPFPGISTNEVATTFFNLNLAEQLRNSVPKVPTNIHSIAMMCLQDDPALRPNFGELTNALNGEHITSSDGDPRYVSFFPRVGSSSHRNAADGDETKYIAISAPLIDGPE